MKPPRTLLLYAFSFSLAAALCGADLGRSRIQISHQDDGFLFKEAGKKILFYRLEPKSLHGKYERSNYIHPLYDLDGNVLTEDFPEDHLHHRGIFWAWHQVIVNGKPIGDQWVARDHIWDVQGAEVLEKHPGALKVRLLWKSPVFTDSHGRQKPFIEETTVLRVHEAGGDMRKVDFEIRLAALEDEVRIGGSDDSKGYGGFSPRIRLPEDIRFLGANGPVTPRDTSVEAGPWLDFTASYGSTGKKSGLAVLCHPSLPNFPQPWILRQKGSMQNPVYPGAKPVLLPKDEPLVFRYRLVLHRGELSREELDRLQRQYESEPLPKY